MQDEENWSEPLSKMMLTARTAILGFIDSILREAATEGVITQEQADTIYDIAAR